MSKKARTHSARELLALRAMREQTWAYERRLEHMSYRDMAKRASLTTEQGGVGRELSEHALSQLVAQYRKRMTDVLADTPEAHLERELHDLDNTQRAIMAQLARDEANGVRLDAALLREFRAAGESRRRLLGADALGPAEPNPRDEDAVLAELNSALKALGARPIKTERSLER